MARESVRLSPALEKLVEPEQQHAAAGTSTVVQSTFNLIKTIAGFGVLTLPAGIERLSDNGLSSNEALFLGVALLLLFGIFNAWSFLLIGDACMQTGTQTYSAAVTVSVGPETARLVMLSSIFICATAAVGCQVVISAMLTDVLAFALHTPFEARPSNCSWLCPRVCTLKPYCSGLQPSPGCIQAAALCNQAAAVPTQALPRRSLQLLVVLLVLLPLCRLPSLKPLAPASLFGVLGTAATALCIVVRQLDGSCAQRPALGTNVLCGPHRGTAEPACQPDALEGSRAQPHPYPYSYPYPYPYP